MPPAAKVAAKPLVKLAPKPAKSGNIFTELADHLSQIGGKTDKSGAIIRASAPVMVAGGPGGKAIQLPGVISTRCETMDAAIGRGGVPMARLTVIAGGEGGGKTTIAGHLCAEVQAMGGIPIYIDNEHKLDLDYFENLGVDLTKLLLSQPGTIEDGLSIMNEAIRIIHAKDPKRPILGILDSINASRSELEFEEDGSADFTRGNQAGLGALARIMSERLPKLMRVISQKPVALVFISQPRDNIGTPGRNLVAGGNAAKFYMALGIELYRKGFWEEAGKKIGSLMVAKCFKNQVAKPMAEGEFGIRWGTGIDYNKSLSDRMVHMALANSGASGWSEMIDPFPLHPKSVKVKKADGEIHHIVKWQGVKGMHKLTIERPDVVAYMKMRAREYLIPKE